MRIFLTGGTGFLGGHFLRLSLEKGCAVTALCRETQAEQLQQNRNLRWLKAPLDAVSKSDLSGCDVLVHFAAAGVSPQKATMDELFRVNLIQSVRLWQDALDAGVRRLVICGSCFEYGRSAERYERIPADAPLEPVTAYGASKAAATMAAVALAAERRCELAVLRPFSVYGEGQHPSNFWPSLRSAALAGRNYAMTRGEQLRDFIPAEQVASRFFDALTAPLPFGLPSIRNVGSGDPVTLRQFAEKWWANFAAKGRLEIGALPYRPNEIMRYAPKL